MLHALAMVLSTLSVALLGVMVVGGIVLLGWEAGRAVLALGEVRRLERLWRLPAQEPRARQR